jgi:hypothetical protein
MKTARKKHEPVSDMWLSLPKAAAELGCSRQGILVAIAKGELLSDHVADRVVVSRESVDAEIDRRKQRAANEEVVAAQ